MFTKSFHFLSPAVFQTRAQVSFFPPAPVHVMLVHNGQHLQKAHAAEPGGSWAHRWKVPLPVPIPGQSWSQPGLHRHHHPSPHYQHRGRLGSSSSLLAHTSHPAALWASVPPPGPREDRAFSSFLGVVPRLISTATVGLFYAAVDTGFFFLLRKALAEVVCGKMLIGAK